MAARRVLGNDPFKRGAAPRVPVATKPVLTPMEAGKRPVTPEVVTPTAKKAPKPAASREPVRHVETPRATPLGPAPAAHANAPTVAADPVPHAAVPTATALGREPAPHAGSPRLSADPVRHDATPEGFSLGRAPARHSHSPFVAADPVAHAAAPVAKPLDKAAPHAHSPSVVADPVAHAAAPVARPLDKAAPHAHSPSVAADPVAHPAAPIARPLDKAAPHAQSPSLKADPVAHAAAPVATRLGKAAPHPDSPTVQADPVKHQATPEATLLTGATPHAHSPSVHADPVPHAATPQAEPLSGSAPVPHAQAPEVEASAPLSERPQRVQLSPSLFSGAGASSSVKGVVGALRAFLGRAGKDTRVDSYGRDEALVEALQPLADALYEKYWRVTVEGAERLPAGAAVLVANHSGALPIDGPLLHHALKRERADLKGARWLLEDQIFYAPGIGVLWNRLGAVRASPENALQLLAEDTPIVVFPEGLQGVAKPFSERYHLQRFGRGGYVKIAARAGVPIVPVAIVGAEESVPLLAKLPGGLLGMEFLPLTLPPLPAKWFIRFGAPVVVEGGAEAAGDLALVQRLNEQVRETIDGMLKTMLAERPGVF